MKFHCEKCDKRLIYWLVQALLFPHEQSTQEGSWRLLTELGYPDGSPRIDRLLEHGEPE